MFNSYQRRTPKFQEWSYNDLGDCYRTRVLSQPGNLTKDRKLLQGSFSKAPCIPKQPSCSHILDIFTTVFLVRREFSLEDLRSQIITHLASGRTRGQQLLPGHLGRPQADSPAWSPAVPLWPQTAENKKGRDMWHSISTHVKLKTVASSCSS